MLGLLVLSKETKPVRRRGVAQLGIKDTQYVQLFAHSSRVQLAAGHTFSRQLDRAANSLNPAWEKHTIIANEFRHKIFDREALHEE
jgi:hypothetical protein